MIDDDTLAGIRRKAQAMIDGEKAFNAYAITTIGWGQIREEYRAAVTPHVVIAMLDLIAERARCRTTEGGK